MVGVTAQMINILTDQNVNTSLAELRLDDVRVTPELGDYSAANFKDAWTTVEIGARAYDLFLGRPCADGPRRPAVAPCETTLRRCARNGVPSSGCASA